MGETLNSYRDIIRRINQKEILIKELEKVNVKVNTGIGIKTSNNNSKVEDLAIKIAEEKENWEQLRERSLKIYNVLFNNIYKLKNDTYKTLLILRYLKLQSWGEIANSLNYSKDYVRTKLHDEARREYEKIFGHIHQ